MSLQHIHDTHSPKSKSTSNRAARPSLRRGRPARAALSQVCLTAALTLLWASVVHAEVRVQFDAAPTIACRDITTPEFAADHPGQRLWEAKLEISSLITGGEQSLQHYFYQVDIIDRQLTFVDYLPKTTLHSQYADAVQVENKDERQKNLGIAVTWDTLVKVTPNAGLSRKQTQQIRYSLLPPKEQMAASGTQRRGRGVYFKLKPSTQHTLEGAKEFAFIFRAPASWRAGAMLLRCQAKSTHKSFFRNETVSAGEGMFMLALHQAGDDHAQRAARRYAQAEFVLRQTAHRYRFEITQDQAVSRFPLSESEPPKIPVGWLERLLVSPGEANWGQFASHLPAPVKQAGDAFLVAKNELVRLEQGAL